MMNYLKPDVNMRKNKNSWSSLVVHSSAELKWILVEANKYEWEIAWGRHANFQVKIGVEMLQAGGRGGGIA
jgi:hypothetical protein